MHTQTNPLIEKAQKTAKDWGWNLSDLLSDLQDGVGCGGIACVSSAQAAHAIIQALMGQNKIEYQFYNDHTGCWTTTSKLQYEAEKHAWPGARVIQVIEQS
jgi:hypothetical protein